MMRSANELAGLVAKAARGAGLPMGHAQDWAAASAWIDTDLPALVAGLESPGPMPTVDWGDPVIVSDSHAVCAGPLILDALVAGCGTIDVGSVTARDLISALAALRGVRVDGDPILRLCDGTVPAPHAGHREIDGGLWSRLEALAAETYVPETADSRLRGAGAGSIDND